MAYARSYRTRSRPRRSSTALRSRPLGTRRGAKKAVRTYKAARFTKAVKSAVASSMETKHVSAVIANNQLINGGGLDNQSTTAASAGYLVPDVLFALDVQQGMASNQRIGDRINPLSCWIRGVVHTNQFDTVTNINFRPFDVHILVFKHVAGRDLPLGQLDMKYETSSSPPAAEPILGTPVNEMLPFSPFYKKIAHRVIRLRPPDTPGIPITPNTERLNTQTSNAPYYKRFAIKVPLPKVFKYDAPTREYPANCWFSVGTYIVDANGVPLGLTQQRARIYMRAQMSYKDA